MLTDYENQYINIIKNILKNGYYDKNRTGVSTYKVPHQIISVDLEKEFPILRTKTVAFKTAVKEMLWIYQTQSNDVTLLQEQNVNIWNEWAVGDTSENLIYVEPRINEKHKELKQIKVLELININAEIRYSNNCGAYYVLNKNLKTNRVTIQFINTGFVNEVPLSSLSTGDLKDYYKRTVNEVGYYGDYKHKEILNYFGKHHKRWVNTWKNMIIRCTDQYYSNDTLYEDVFVDESFHSCENFLRWVIKNNRYEKSRLSDLQLDKDYYKSNCYSDITCVLLTPKENDSLNLKEWYKFNDQIFFSKSDLANYFKEFIHLKSTHKQNGQYNDSTINRFINLFIKEEGLEILYPNNLVDGKYLRFDLSVRLTIKKAYGYQIAKFKQIDKLIHQLKTNPQDRRMIISLWNIEDLEDMQLQPCCFQTIWDVSNGRLNCLLIQRSADAPLGLPFNTTQYAVLVHLIAQSTNLKVGMLTHVISNCHIYENQLEGIKENIRRYDKMIDISKKNKTLLSNEENEYLSIYESNAKLDIKKDITDFYEFNIDDINIRDYQKLSSIKMAVSI